jgi:spore coat polysaccharide biosynthesis protein SpsF
MKKIVIGIQCRTNSERLPGKAMMKIGEDTIIEHVVKSCVSSAKYLNSLSKYNAHTRVVLLVPHGDDKLIEHMKSKVEIFEGSEHDVLRRYIDAAKAYRADYMVRVTGDCFYIPSHTVSRHVKRIVRRHCDYVNNILQRCQPEGWDCEVMSSQLLSWLDDNATTDEDREHVTTFIPKAMKAGCFPKTRFTVSTATDHFDLSHIKTSIDTQEDYDRACLEFETRKQKYDNSLKIGSVF